MKILISIIMISGLLIIAIAMFVVIARKSKWRKIFFIKNRDFHLIDSKKEALH